MTGWLLLLHQQAKQVPGLPDLPWRIRGNTAVASLDDLGRMYLRGRTLVVEQAPEPLPWVNRLHAVGWKRRSLPASVPGWVIAAELVEGDAVLRVQGTTFRLPDGTDWHDADPHSSMDYFSPSPPEMRGREWHARIKDWNDRMRTGDWDGWTHTPFIEGTQ